jgi:hypothetical protein
MKTFSFSKWMLMALFLITAMSLSAQNKISIQSTLKDINGKAIPDGEQRITFRLYNVLTGGIALWQEVDTVEVVGGIYSHKLGSNTPLIPAHFGASIYLGVTLSTGTELSPRTELTAAPFAMSVSSIAANNQSAGFVDNTFTTSDAANIQGNLSFNGNLLSTGLGGHINISSGDLNVYDGPDSSLTTKRINLGDGDTGLRSTQDGHLGIMSNSAEVITVSNRRIGINTENPKAALHVGSYINGANYIFNGLLQRYFRFANTEASDLCIYSTPPFQQTCPINSVVARFDGNIITDHSIYATSTYIESDDRIKNVLGQSNNATDLRLLNQLKITDYTMIDHIKDNRQYKKVIAQELEKVFPQAVSRKSGVLPDIFVPATHSAFKDKNLVISIDKSHGLRKGDKIDIIAAEGKFEELEVVAVADDHTFTVSTEKPMTNIFVYGKHVNDFRVVDYEAIAMLNVSATQALYEKITKLEAENNALKTATADLNDRMSKLEAMVSSKIAPENLGVHQSSDK